MMLLKSSISGGILILLIIILRFLAINKLPKRTFVLLWDIALLRLLLPFDLPFHLPFFRSIALPVRKAAGGNPSISNMPVIQGNIKNIPADTPSLYLGNVEWGKVIWFAGMLMLMAFLGFLYLREYKRMQTALPVSKEAEEKLKLLANIPGRVKILVSDRTSTPLTYGIFSPAIILPEFMKLDDNTELKYVLTHELIHIKRADNLCKIIMLIAVSIHWFNPFVWLMYILFNRDIELSCDERVISLLGWECRKEYAKILVGLAQKQYDRSFFSNGFGKNAVQERIVAIMKLRKATVVSIMCAVVLLGASITVFAQNNPVTDNENNDLHSTVEIADVMESVSGDAGISPARDVASAEWFSEYEEYGLSYDASNDHLMYGGNIVGYFHDEREKDVYTHITDEAGTIGIVVSRDSAYKITGLKTTMIGFPSGVEVVSENPEDCREDCRIQEKSSYSYSYEKNEDDDSLTLKPYESYVISFSEGTWHYEGKQIAGLIDDNGYIYINEEVDNPIFLQISNDSAKEISEEEFNELLENVN